MPADLSSLQRCCFALLAPVKVYCLCHALGLASGSEDLALLHTMVYGTPAQANAPAQPDTSSAQAQSAACGGAALQ